MALELGVDLGALPAVFSDADPKSAEHQQAARAAMLTLFAGSPAALVYAALPLAQPMGWRAILPALRETLAVVRAAFYKDK